MPLPRLRTVARWTALALFLAASAAAVWLLYYGGRYLQHEDPLQKADAIFVLSGTRLERPLEAMDLYNQLQVKQAQPGKSPRYLSIPSALTLNQSVYYDTEKTKEAFVAISDNIPYLPNEMPVDFSSMPLHHLGRLSTAFSR